jgi:hypothetical protein
MVAGDNVLFLKQSILNMGYYKCEFGSNKKDWCRNSTYTVDI